MIDVVVLSAMEARFAALERRLNKLEDMIAAIGAEQLHQNAALAELKEILIKRVIGQDA